MNARHRIDDRFEAWGRWVYRRRLPVLAFILGILIALGSYLPHMRIENSSESFLRGDDPASLAYSGFQRQFGQDDRVLIAIQPREVFDAEFLETLRAFHRDLETQVPHVAEVTSLVNARQTRGEGDTLVVGELLEDWDSESGDLDELRRRVLGNPLYLDNLISRDGRMTTVTIEPSIYTAGQPDGAGDDLTGFDEPGDDPGIESLVFLTEGEKGELVTAVERVADRYAGPEFAVHIVGGPVLVASITRKMGDEARSIMSVSALAIALFLYVLFRRFSGVVFPLAVVAAALVATLGTIVSMDIPFSIVLGVLPVFTMCVGVCNAVHVLVLGYRQLGAGSGR